MNQPLIVDTDGGIDDALALLMLIALDRSPELITTCFGNVSLPQASENILDTLAIVGHECPVYPGAAAPLLGSIIDATHIHGEDGLGGAKRPARKTTLQTTIAVDAIRNRLKRAITEENPVEILTLGPLTNLATVILADSSVTTGIGRLVVMGGTHTGRGNDSPCAEFNVLADPESAAIVLSKIDQVEMVPWEPCVDNPIPGNVVDESLNMVANREKLEFLKAICDQGRSVHREQFGTDGLVMADPLAASVLIQPEIVQKSISCPVQVECSGQYTRGMTIPIHKFEPNTKEPITNIVTSIDSGRVESLFQQCFSWINAQN